MIVSLYIYIYDMANVYLDTSTCMSHKPPKMSRLKFLLIITFYCICTE